MRISPPLTALAVAATTLLLQSVSASSLPADVLFFENFENPDVPSYSQGITPDIWVRAAMGFGSGDHGMTDKSGGDFSSPAGNEQAYALRYTNSGITTKEFALGPPLVFGGGYEVSFDVVKDNSNAGRAYNVRLIAFGAGAVRNDCRSIPTGSTQLATATGNAPADGSIATVTFTFFPSVTTHSAEFGKDPGIRVIGSVSSAIIDNIRFRAIPGTSTGLDLIATSPVDDSSNNLASLPAKAIFNKNIAAGSGNITLRNLTDNIDTVIPVGDPRISISGTCLNIAAGTPYTWGKNYAIRIDPGAVIETSPGSNSFAGIADDTTWNFTMAGGDPLYYSISRLKDHITGTITLTAEEIDTIKRNLDTVVGRFAESPASITALLDLINTYDTGTITGRKGPLWVNQSLPRRNVVINDLHWTMFIVMQNVMDRIYTRQTLATHEILLNGFKFGSSSNFPGNCIVPSPTDVHTTTISASYLKTYGPPIMHDGPGTFARKPTGCYLSPGTIATVTVPASLVNTGYKIRVGCHSWDFSNRPDIKRLDRVTRVYDITSTSTRIANPLGGGIYIEVPWLANAGVVDVDVTGAVRSPYFSAKSFHQTTAAEWETIERLNPAPWADFQTDKFMMQVPKSWIYNMTGAQAIQLMADWDAAIDAVNDLMGYTAFNPATGPEKYIRGKETMYPQVDLQLRASVYAPGYPSVNVSYSPTASYNGYVNSHLVRGPQNAPYYEFHEQGHAYLFPKFGGETESAVNLLHVPVWNRKFGKSMDEAFRGSMGSTRTFQTLDTTAMVWMCVFNFSPRELPMASAEKSYQLKGHAKFVDIANLYGWDVLGKFWGIMVDNEENNISYATDNDSMLFRLCQAVGKDIRPLFHFWGIHPANPSALAAKIAAANPPIPADDAIKNRLLYYKSLVPANNAAFRTFAQNWWGRQPSINGFWEEREHSRQWDQTALFGTEDQQRADITINEEYIEACADQIRDRVQELVDLYFPESIAPDTMSFAIAPSAVDPTTIGMVATTATSGSGPIQYYFENTTNNTNSGWISSANWSQSGLITGQSYTYRVKARDSLPNETAWSPTASATAQADATPPSPSPMTFATPPTTISPDSITMTASTATDINGVEYFFDCLTPGGNDSGWQDSPTYTDTGLGQSTEYTYQVQARDKSPAQNTTAFSATASATTPTIDTTPPSVHSLNPPDDSVGVPVDANLVITFNELIGPSTGSITLKNLSDATQTVIDINDGTQITISGSDLTINPTSNLLFGKTYAVRIDATALQDSVGNPFAGIADDTIWSFSTLLAPPIIDGTWNVDAAGNWSVAGNWFTNPVNQIPGVEGSTVGLNNNITGARTITINDTSRTVGTLNIGDSDNTHYFTLAASGGAGLVVNNNGSGATITTTTTLATVTTVRDTISAPITLADNLTASVAGTYSGGVTSAGYLAISGNISEAGGVRSITKSGNGTLILTGNNTYSGGFTLNAGSVQVTGATNEVNNSYNGFGSGILTINGGTVSTRSAGGFTTANDSAWNGSFFLYRGQTGTATWNHQGDITLGNNITATSTNANFVLNVSGDIGETTGGAKSLTLTALTTTLSGSSTYTGGTNVTSGTIQFGKTASMSATGTVAMSTGTTLIVNAGGTGEFTGATSGNGSIGGLLEAPAIGGQGAPVTWAGTARLGIDTTNATGGSLTYSGTIANRGTSMALLKTGAGNLVLDQASTYTGATSINQGNLVAGSNSPNGAAGAFGNTNSEVNLGVALSNSNAGLLIGGAFNVGRIIRIPTNNGTDSGSRVLTIGGNTADNSEFSGNIFLGTTNQAGRGVTLTAASGGQVTFSGVIQNPTGQDTNEANAAAAINAVTKAGVGTVVLSNTNTYTGRTTITEGTLTITGPTQSTTAITFTAGSLGLDTGFPVTAANAAVNLTNGSIRVTGSTGAASYTLLTAASISGTPVLAEAVPGYELQLNPGNTELLLVQTDPVGALDHFAISAIGSPQTVGTPITGITITAQDASNQTVTSFNGTVTFSGTGGFSGTSATFTAGVLSDVSVTPANAGSNLTLVVTDPVSGKSGFTTITTIQSQYEAWASGAAFDADANGDGIENGLAFLLGAGGPDANASGKLPVAEESAGGLKLIFQMLPSTSRGTATLAVQHSNTLASDSWLTVAVPETSGTVDDVVFTITGINPLNVTATIPVSKAASGKLFGRVIGTNP
jgi:autotransporter-associated beta strand protein